MEVAVEDGSWLLPSCGSRDPRLSQSLCGDFATHVGPERGGDSVSST